MTEKPNSRLTRRTLITLVICILLTSATIGEMLYRPQVRIINGDDTAPDYTPASLVTNGITANTTVVGQNVELSCVIPNGGISSYYFSWNNSGQWVDSTPVMTSESSVTAKFTGKWSTCSVVSVVVYARSISGLWAHSQVYNFTITALTSLIYDNEQYEATGYPSYTQRVFQACGRWWAVWFNGTNGYGYIYYSSSTNGVTWSDPSFVVDSVTSLVNAWNEYAIWFDGTHVHIVISAYGSISLNYVRGTPDANGKITWQPVQKVMNSKPMISYMWVGLCVDSNGYPWITYRWLDSSTNTNYPFVIKSSTNDGTWSTAAGFPYQLASTNGTYLGWSASPYPLPSGKVSVFYANNFNLTAGNGYVQTWDGTHWLSKAQTTTPMGGENSYFCYTVVNDGDKLRLFYTNTAWQMATQTYDYATNSFDKESVICGDIAGSEGIPHVTIDPETGTLINVFLNPYSWSGGVNGYYHEMDFVKCVNGVWDKTPTVLAKVQYSEYLSFVSTIHTYNGYVGILYCNNGTGGAPPYGPFNVMFMLLPIDSDVAGNNNETALGGMVTIAVPTVCLSLIFTMYTCSVVTGFGIQGFGAVSRESSVRKINKQYHKVN